MRYVRGVGLNKLMAQADLTGIVVSLREEGTISNNAA
jgi:hypothetical protein